MKLYIILLFFTGILLIIRGYQNNYKNFYTSRSLVETDLDPEYQFILPLNRSFYEGVKNTKDTTIDGDSSIVVRVTSPTVAVPFDSADSNLQVIDD